MKKVYKVEAKTAHGRIKFQCKLKVKGRVSNEELIEFLDRIISRSITKMETTISSKKNEND